MTVNGRVLTVLGLYWIAIAIYSRWATAKDPESSRARWVVWILPWALSVDNITYGLVSGHILPHHKVGHYVAPPAVSTSDP